MPPDESLTPREYEELGFPPFDAAWSAEERTTARSALRTLAAERPERLPRYASRTSGAAFEKLIDEEFERRDLHEGAVGSMPVGKLEEMDDAELTGLIRGDTLDGIYAPQATGGLLFDRELVQFSSRRLTELATLREDLQTSLAEVEESSGRGADSARYRELMQTLDGVILRMVANMTAFAVAERFTPAARSDAAALLAEQVPLVAPRLTADARADLRSILLEAGASAEADPRLKALADAEW